MGAYQGFPTKKSGTCKTFILKKIPKLKRKIFLYLGEAFPIFISVFFPQRFWLLSLTKRNYQMFPKEISDKEHQ